LKLADLRKLAIRGQSKIHFRIRNGRECVINEQGIAQVPGWHGIPDFNLEDELAAAAEFLLEPVSAPEKGKSAPRPRQIGRQELESMVSAAPSAAAAAHEEE